MSMMIDGGLGLSQDKQLFGAQVVSKTLDYMNNYGGAASAAPFDKQTFGAAVVSKTLDYMNSGGTGMDRSSQSYDFQKSVLSAAYNPVGAITNKIG
ncbi:hypothetical protein [Salidesulfovibrio brasiliensis]|uniref:hypothetical protein n=1 Tax=Salidesulfovibrio brasiliensis TaxID=221711 RepID=UPI0006D17C21|nr:hypothetical protein [Salidesulfovibrio brasiliensis]